LISDSFHALGRGRVLVSRFGRLFGKLVDRVPRSDTATDLADGHTHDAACNRQVARAKARIDLNIEAIRGRNCASALERFGSHSSVCTAVGPFAQLVCVASITCTRRLNSKTDGHRYCQQARLFGIGNGLTKIHPKRWHVAWSGPT
jgi:hypothetical protein